MGAERVGATLVVDLDGALRAELRDGAGARARDALGALTVGARVGARLTEGLFRVVDRGMLTVGVLAELLLGLDRLTEGLLRVVDRGILAVGVLAELLLGLDRLTEGLLPVVDRGRVAEGVRAFPLVAEVPPRLDRSGGAAV